MIYGMTWEEIYWIGAKVTAFAYVLHIVLWFDYWRDLFALFRGKPIRFGEAWAGVLVAIAYLVLLWPVTLPGLLLTDTGKRL